MTSKEDYLCVQAWKKYSSHNIAVTAPLIWHSAFILTHLMHHNANIYTQKKNQMHIHITVLAFRCLDLRMSDQLTETTGVPEDASFRSRSAQSNRWWYNLHLKATSDNRKPVKQTRRDTKTLKMPFMCVQGLNLLLHNNTAIVWFRKTLI